MNIIRKLSTLFFLSLAVQITAEASQNFKDDDLFTSLTAGAKHTRSYSGSEEDNDRPLKRKMSNVQQRYIYKRSVIFNSECMYCFKPVQGGMRIMILDQKDCDDCVKTLVFPTIFALPKVPLNHVLKFLDQIDRDSLSLTCKYMNEKVNSFEEAFTNKLLGELVLANNLDITKDLEVFNLRCQTIGERLHDRIKNSMTLQEKLMIKLDKEKLLLTPNFPGSKKIVPLFNRVGSFSKICNEDQIENLYHRIFNQQVRDYEVASQHIAAVMPYLLASEQVINDHLSPDLFNSLGSLAEKRRVEALNPFFSYNRQATLPANKEQTAYDIVITLRQFIKCHQDPAFNALLLSNNSHRVILILDSGSLYRVTDGDAVPVNHNIRHFVFADPYGEVDSTPVRFLKGYENLLSCDISGLTNLRDIRSEFLSHCRQLEKINYSGLANIKAVKRFFMRYCDKISDRNKIMRSLLTSSIRANSNDMSAFENLKAARFLSVKITQSVYAIYHFNEAFKKRPDILIIDDYLRWAKCLISVFERQKAIDVLKKAEELHSNNFTKKQRIVFNDLIAFKRHTILKLKDIII